MSLDFHFLYNSDDKAQFEVKEVICDGLQDLFEYYPTGRSAEDIALFERSAFYPEFVRDFPKLREYESSDVVYDDDFSEEYEEGSDIYEGPLFHPEVVIAWANAWIHVIGQFDEKVKRHVLPMATQSHDCTPAMLKDLRQLALQGECAKKAGIQMQLIMA